MNLLEDSQMEYMGGGMKTNHLTYLYVLDQEIYVWSKKNDVCFILHAEKNIICGKDLF